MLDAPARTRAATPEVDSPAFARGAPPLRRDLADDFSTRRSRAAALQDPSDESAASGRRNSPRGVRIRLGRSVPRSLAGRIFTGIGFFAGLGGLAFGFSQARAALLHDARLVIPSSHAIEITGNNHLTRAQLLSVFGEDVDRNLLTVPLDARRAELESLPWVEHATVMRLLPNRIRIAIVERTPVAFVRQGSEISLVDAHGVLLDYSPESTSDHSYSFPILSGISAADPASTRVARMKLYLRFTGDLDAGPDKISRRLSEVDLTDPEDIKALLPDSGTSILVHFGDNDFLTRYQRYVQNLPDWKARYPKLASVDMRYEHDVVLEMAPGAAVPIAGEAAGPSEAAATPGAAAAKKPPSKRPAGRQKALPVHPKVGPR